MDFLDTERFAPMFRGTVRELARGQVGLALDLRFYLGVSTTLPPGEQQGVVEAVHVELDGAGQGRTTLPPTPVLFPAVAREVDARVLGVFDVQGQSVRRIDAARARVRDGEVVVDAGPDAEARGRTVAALVLRRFNHPDMFSGAYPRAFRRVLEAYRDVGLRGAALDEFAYLPLRPDQWRTTLFFSEASAVRFRETYGAELEDVIARMLLGPDGAGRIRAALHYFEHHCRAIATVEDQFYQAVKQTLGPDAFVGVHPTNQTLASYDDMERSLTFVDWWAVPRDFGQTDEATPMAVRMALALRAGGPVWYNMFYHHDVEAIFDEIARCARYGGRVHFHAVNDRTHGHPLEQGDLLERLTAMARRLGPLDQHVRGVPELDTLVVLGWPAILLGEGTAYGEAMRFLNALWEAGYRAAAVPTYALDQGELILDERGARYHGRSFSRVIVWHPEFARPALIAGLKRLFAGAARVQVVGPLTVGWDGEPLEAWPALASHATTAEAILTESGPARGEVGVRFPGGLLVLVDRETLVHGGQAERVISVDGQPHRFSFSGCAVIRLVPGEPPERVR